MELLGYHAGPLAGRWGFAVVALTVVFMLLPLGSAIAASVEVQISGVKPDMEKAIRNYLTLTQESEYPSLTPYRIERLYERAPQEIRRALQPFGYYSPSIAGDLTKIGPDKWRAVYSIDLGPPVHVRNVSIRFVGPGSDDPALLRWRENFPLSPGDILLHQLYEQAKSRLQQLLRDRGYLDAKLATHQIRVRISDLSADIALEVQTGTRYRFGNVVFNNVPLRDSFLHRFVPFKPGDPYDAEQVYRLQRDLIDSNYFQRADVTPLTNYATDHRVPIAVALTMAKRTRYTAGVGYGTDTGARITLGVQRRWANSRGHRYGVDVLVAQRRDTVAAHYRVPLKRPAFDYLTYLASLDSEETTTSFRETGALSATFTHSFARWQRTMGVTYAHERFEVGTQRGRSNMLYPEIGFQQIHATSRIFPVRGWRLTADFKVAGDKYGSSTDLLQGELGAKDIRPLLGGRLITRADVGASEVSNFNSLPVSLRYFAGGDQSVRGYAYQSLGPTNEQGDVIGGKNLLVGSAEYDYYFTERTGVAVFMDAGNAFNSFDDYRLKRGAGIGMRWHFPFGVVRLDLANALSEPQPAWRVHLSIGPEL